MNATRAGSIYLLGNIAAAIVPFLLLPLLTRVLPPSQYGAIINFTLLMAAVAAFAGLGVHGLLGVAWFRQQGDSLARETSAAVAVAIGSTLAAAAALVLIVAAMAPQALGFGPRVAALAALAAGAQVLVQCRLVLWQSAHRPWPNTLLQFAASGLNVALSLFGVLVLGLGGEGRIAAIAAATLAAAGFALWALAREGLLGVRPRRLEVKAVLAFGLPLVPHTLAGVLLTSGDRFVVSARLGAEALGSYGAAAQLGAVMAIIADAFAKAFNPWLFRRLQSGRHDDRLQAVGAIYAAVPTFLLLGVCVGAVLFVIGPLMLGAAYRDALALLPWFMLGGALCGIYLAVSGLFFFHGRTGALSAVSFLCTVAGFVVTAVLVERFGVAGAAAGYAATQALLATVVWLTARQRFDLPWRDPAAAMKAWRNGNRAAEGSIT